MPRKTSLIIKLIGRKIGYHFLSKRLQTMLKTQSVFSLIDRPTEFFIVKFTSKRGYNNALLNGPWMIGEHYLHFQCWRPNFMAIEDEINLLPIWIRFSVLPFEYCTSHWLYRAGNKSGRTLKVDEQHCLLRRGNLLACASKSTSPNH